MRVGWVFWPRLSMGILRDRSQCRVCNHFHFCLATLTGTCVEELGEKHLVFSKDVCAGQGGQTEMKIVANATLTLIPPDVH